jgi:hypothetical protein
MAPKLGEREKESFAYVCVPCGKAAWEVEVALHSPFLTHVAVTRA